MVKVQLRTPCQKDSFNEHSVFNVIHRFHCIYKGLQETKEAIMWLQVYRSSAKQE